MGLFGASVLAYGGARNARASTHLFVQRRSRHSCKFAVRMDSSQLLNRVWARSSECSGLCFLALELSKRRGWGTSSALLTFPRRRTPAAKLGRRQMLRSRGMPGQRSRPKRRRHHRCPHTSRTYWSFAADLLAASSAGLSPGSRMILAIVQAFSGLWSHLEARFGFLARNYSLKTKNLRNQSMFYTCRT